MTPTIYCLCTVEKPNYLASDTQKNLILKASECSASEREIFGSRGFLFDDSGDNISSMNRYFGQLSGLYWAWKNATDQYLGTCTYRIYWKDRPIIEPNDLIIPKASTVLVNMTGEPTEGYTIKEQYIFCHGDTMLKFLYGVLSTENHPITVKMMEEAMSAKAIHGYNIFIGRNDTFNRICKILFDVLFSILNSFGDFFSVLENKIQQIRFFDFLAERILHTIFVNANTLLPGINIREAETIVLPRL